MGARLAGGQPEQRPARETLGAVLEVLLCAVGCNSSRNRLSRKKKMSRRYSTLKTLRLSFSQTVRKLKVLKYRICSQ